MHAEYRSVLAHLDAQPDVRAVVVTGTPPAFCVGGDSDALAGHAERGSYDSGLSGDEARPGYGVRPEFDQDFAFQFAMRFPIIAAVNGACAGIGLALALFCDLRFGVGDGEVHDRRAEARPAGRVRHELDAAPPGRRHPGDRPAAVRPGVHARPRPRSGGCGTASPPTARRAARWRTDYAAQLVDRRSGPTAVRMTKRQIYDDLLAPRRRRRRSPSRNRLLTEAMGTAEYREGVAALRERRPPQF